VKNDEKSVRQWDPSGRFVHGTVIFLSSFGQKPPETSFHTLWLFNIAMENHHAINI
jgi:hypothetical protein